MNKTTCYYVVKAQLAIYNKITSETEFPEFQKKFENENPILAREAAFNYYENFIHGLLLGQGLNEGEIENITDREIRKILNPYIDPKTSTKIRFGENEIEMPNYIGNGIWVNMVITNDEDNEITIHSISNDKADMPYPPNRSSLEEEYEFYSTNNYDTKDYATIVNYFDVEEYEEVEGSEETAFGTHTILRTPFDWAGYDKKNWWGKDEEIENEAINISREEYLKGLIGNGEGEQIEFKPTLLYHFDKKGYSKTVRYIIAKTICSFLNSKGGHLFVGITDNQEIQGLHNDFSLARPNRKDPRDYFKLEVDKIIREYFKDIACNINSDFEKIGGIEIFVFTIFPSKNYPVFLKGQNGKEFYVRLTASSEPYTDIEEIVKYCLTHWNTSK